MNFYSKIIILTTSILCFSSCMGTDEAELAGKFLPPQVAVCDATISNESTTVVLNASYKQSSSSTVIDEVGFYYGDDSELTSAEKLVAGTSNETFSVKVLPNTYGKEYFYKAYLSNGKGEILSSVKSFTKPAFDYYVTLDVPKVVAASGSDLTISSTISKAEGITLSEAGVFYSSDSDVTIDDTKVTSSNTETINVEIKGLSTGTKYYMCSYVMDREYIALSETVEFVPHAVPSVTTVNVSNISYKTAVSGGSSISDNGLDIISKGVVWSTEVNPTIELETKTENGAGKEDYVADLSGLSPGTKYFIRAYAINSDGVGYGNEITFETLSQSNAIVTTNAPSEVTSSSAMSGGNVTSDGGAEVTGRGVVWSTDHNPTISLDTKTSDGTGVGKFTSAIIGLAPGTTYYVRAYVTNSIGTSYGDEMSFETQAVKPTVSTNILNNDVISELRMPFLGGNVISTGGAEVTEKGVVWSTSPNPTVEQNKISGGGGLGEFEVWLSEPSVATRYYIRAYAINSAGVAYGEEVSFYVTSLFFCFDEVVGITENNFPELRLSSLTWSSEEFDIYDYFIFGYVSRSSNEKIFIDGGIPDNLAMRFAETIEKPFVVKEEIPFNTEYTPQLFVEHDLSGIVIYNSSGEGRSYFHKIPEIQFSEAIVSTLLSNQATLKSEVGYITDLPFGFRYNTITNCGIVWSTEPNPTIALQTKTDEGAILGQFTSTIKGLMQNTTYYARPYAINPNGVAYGEQITFTTPKQEGATENLGNEGFEW